jgi:HTH-type transcriptional regulator / antitoxin HigA
VTVHEHLTALEARGELFTVYHPGDWLASELEDRGLNQSDLARAVGYPRSTVNAVITGRMHISPVFALCLEEALGLPTAEQWMAMQAHYQIAALRTQTDYS